jgi:hypothetical protein
VAKNSGQSFDPRFDPAFQRGYKPKPGSVERTKLPVASPAPQQPTRSNAVAPQLSPEPVRLNPGQPTGSDTGHRTPANPGSEVAGVRSAGSSSVAGTIGGSRPAAGVGNASSYRDPGSVDDDGAGLAERDALYPDVSPEVFADTPTRNPYIVALWTIGIGLTLVGLGILASAVYALVASTPIVAYDRTMDELGIYTSTPLITVGLATIVGLLFVSAIRRRR